MRGHLTLLAIMMSAGAVPAACGGTTTTNYGPPDGLVDRTPPQPTATSSSTATSTGTGTATAPPDSGSPPGDSGAPVEAGGGTDGQTTMGCSVTWTKDVFPLLGAAGAGGCAGQACHANGTGNLPTIVDGDPATTYTNLRGYTLIDGMPYIAPGNMSAGGSMMYCNLVSGACGGIVMPQPPYSLTAAQKATIGTWITCGSPM